MIFQKPSWIGNPVHWKKEVIQLDVQFVFNHKKKKKFVLPSGEIENQWKTKLEDIECKYSKQIVELRELLVEKELTFLKEEEEKVPSVFKF